MFLVILSKNVFNGKGCSNLFSHTWLTYENILLAVLQGSEIGLEKSSGGAPSDSPETRRSTAVPLLTDFAADSLAVAKPVAGPLPPEQGTRVRGPITHPGPELC